MATDLMVVILLALGFVCLATMVLVGRGRGERRRKSKTSKIRVVDEYAIDIVERSGFRYIHLRFLSDDGASELYEFVPPYAHALSDELCMASARAAREKKSSNADANPSNSSNTQDVRVSDLFELKD